jgi:hypothetical protein
MAAKKTKSRKSPAKKSKVPKVKDLSPRKNPRGGGISYNTDGHSNPDGRGGGGGEL